MKLAFSKMFLSASLLTSTVGVAAGFWQVWSYERTPGRAAAAAALWPADCPLGRRASVSTLVVALHPGCPCSRATVAELAVLMARYPGRLDVFALFVRPPGFTQDWATADLWKLVSEIPGAHAISDDTQMAVALFGAQTSGQVLLYDGAGRLRFHGGVTTARGHVGDSDGLSAIEAFMDSGSALIEQTPVYGCALQ